MYDEKAALERLSRAVHSIAYGGIQTWPADMSWANDLAEAVKGAEVLGREGFNTPMHPDLLIAVSRIETELTKHQTTLSAWLDEYKKFVETGEGYDLLIRLGAEIVYNNVPR